MYDGRTRLAQQVAEEVRTHFPDEVLETVIPRSVRVSEAPSFGQTVIAYDGQSAGAVAYREAAVEIIRRDSARQTLDGELLMAKRTGLGRGIGALIPTSETGSRRDRSTCSSPGEPPIEEIRGAHRGLVPVPGSAVQIDPHAIVPNPRQPRTNFDADDLAELVHSVREFGVLQPVVVRDDRRWHVRAHHG